ncbi:ComF family protein [Chitinophaga lutea]|uniref:ComF family protein n=1 Tax=Chitinophaga lutea TaxID=2488634 RepID=A0A3N4PYG6_9BACT|nr:phosphoribosyltransferase family protein [Chitinophaga lutea]RPE13762.1 ComF family protein [Chitinophaga lutea]
MLHPLLHLLYPRTCECCGLDLSRREEVLCLRCAVKLPVTNFHSLPHNPVEKIFWGRVQLRHATAGYYFGRHAHLQRLIHQFKYHGRKDIALYMGRQLGLQLQQSSWWQQLSLIVPVPLNRLKQRHRGYNQAALLAAGIAGVLGCPMQPDVLARAEAVTTQTHQSRPDRWNNVATAFALGKPAAVRDRHILLVDDVLTTGATLEACARALLVEDKVSVSICSLAYASR